MSQRSSFEIFSGKHTRLETAAESSDFCQPRSQGLFLCLGAGKLLGKGNAREKALGTSLNFTHSTKSKTKNIYLQLELFLFSQLCAWQWSDMVRRKWILVILRSCLRTKPPLLGLLGPVHTMPVKSQWKQRFHSENRLFWICVWGQGNNLIITSRRHRFCFQNISCPHENEMPAFSNPSGLKSVFEKDRKSVV